MIRRILALAVTIVVAACGVVPPETSETSPSPTTPRTEKIAVSQGVVTKVTDGDTIHFRGSNGDRVIRIIGINTPETVAPGTGVQCYGPEASAEARRVMPVGTKVILVYDPSQGSLDKYGRTLAYVQVEGLPGSDYGLHMIRAGFAHEYTYSRRYVRQKTYREAQKAAQASGVGLWGAC